MLLRVGMAVKMAKDSIYMKNSFETIMFDGSQDIGILTINRPAKLNALNICVLRELKICLTEIHSTRLNGLIVVGEGEKAFIAGADISEMKSMTNGEAEAFSELGQQVSLLFESLPFPCIAAVNGFALGGGFEMAMSCDFILSSVNAVFGLPEVKLGLVPGFGGTQRLSRIVGERRAKELMFSGRNVSSEEAKRLGITLEVYPSKSELLEACYNWFKVSLQNSPHAIARAKYALRLGMEENIKGGLALEKNEFGNIFQTPEMIEGTSAFLEKRRANFKGSNI